MENLQLSQILMTLVQKLQNRQELPKVAAEVERASGAALVSDYLTTWDVEENGGRGWLTGLLLGYPVWSTVARYKVGGFEGGKFTK